MTDLSVPSRESTPSKRFVTLAMSGGGSRAIAFHLGCLRALHDRGILPQIRVISTVSGGSVIGALHAYGGHSSFQEFENGVVGLLKTGLQARIVRAAIFSRETSRIVLTLIINGGGSLFLGTVQRILTFVRRITGWEVRGIQALLAKAEDRLPVWGSLTTAFERVLARNYFANTRLRDVLPPNLEVVINTCDLRTGAAFRFGSRTSGGWRYGQIVDGNEVNVAKAVAASAAFPLVLPPLVERFTFSRGDQIADEVVVLTDGGVIDNLGVTVLEPGRNSDVSVNVYESTHIICLNAGAGQFPLGRKTLWLPSRIVRSFETVHRKAQDAAYGRLHRYAETRELSGFVMVYLGQDDQKLPVRPPDLIPREAVRDYPTDFAPMSERDIALLTGRGEQLTRILVDRYLSDL